MGSQPMADWKERGYVPDSDDEDEIDLGSAPSATDPPKVPRAFALTLASEAKPFITFNEITENAEPESPAGSIAAGASREAHNTLAGITELEAGEEPSESYTFGKAATGELKQDN